MEYYRGSPNQKVQTARMELDKHTNKCDKCTDVPDDASDYGFNLCGKGSRLYAAFQKVRKG